MAINLVLSVDLDNSAEGNIVIGQGTGGLLQSLPMSGAVTMDETGTVTIADNYVTPAMLAYTPQEYTLKEVTLTTAQVKSMYTTPIELIANPCDSDDIINIIDAYAYMPYNSINYAGGGVIRLAFTSDTSTIIGSMAAASIQGGVSAYRKFTPGDNLHTSFDGTGISITCADADFTTGDSPLRIGIYYTTINI